MKAKYLEGENIKPRTAKEGRALIGSRVRYLRDVDVDRSGRGYFFPQSGRVVDAVGCNLAINDQSNFIAFSEIAEMVSA